MSARITCIDGMRDWLARFGGVPLEQRAHDERSLLRRRLENFLDDLIAANDLDGTDVDFVTFDALLDELDRI